MKESIMNIKSRDELSESSGDIRENSENPYLIGNKLTRLNKLT